jgi:hypothetical protein
VPPSVSLAVGVKLYWEPTVTEMAGVPEMVARAMVPVVPVLPALVPAVSFAVPGFTLTPSPPPHAASAQETSRETQTALISLKVKSTLLPAVRRGQQKPQEFPRTQSRQAKVPEKRKLGCNAASGNKCKPYAGSYYVIPISDLCRHKASP